MSAEGPPVETKSRIPVTLVTGFLGSGKTTLINAALRSPELAKTVVVVNEFGEVGLDHQLFAQQFRLRGRPRERLPLLHCSKRPGRHAQFALPRPTGRRDPGLRQCRDRDVGPRRARPGASGFPVGTDAGRALSRRERADARRCRQLARNVRSARRVGSAGRAGGPDPDHETRHGHRRQTERLIANPAPSPPDQPVSRDRGGRLVVGGGREAPHVSGVRLGQPAGGSPSVAQCGSLSKYGPRSRRVRRRSSSRR